MTAKEINKALIILGTASFIYWPKVFKEGFFVPVRFDLIFFFVVVISLCFFIDKIIKKKNYGLTYKENEIYLVLSVFLLSILIATTISFIRYDLGFDFKGISYLLKVLLGIILFIVVHRYLKEDKLFYKKLSFAFYVPSLFFIFFIFSPQLAEDLDMLAGGNRFQGLMSNPAIFAQLALVASSYSVTFLLFSLYKKRLVNLFINLIVLLGLSILIYWTQTRTYLIALFGVITISNILVAKYFNKDLFKALFFIFLLSVFILCLFFLLPDSIRNLLEIRLYQSFDTTEETRYSLLKYYVEQLSLNPFGLGLNYEQKFTLEWHLSNGEVWNLGPHSFLDIAVFGGILAVFCMIYLLWKVFLNLRQRLKNYSDDMTAYYLASSTAVFGLWIASIFMGSPIFFLGFWILLAMALI